MLAGRRDNCILAGAILLSLKFLGSESKQYPSLCFGICHKRLYLIYTNITHKVCCNELFTPVGNVLKICTNVLFLFYFCKIPETSIQIEKAKIFSFQV